MYFHPTYFEAVHYVVDKLPRLVNFVVGACSYVLLWLPVMAMIVANPYACLWCVTAGHLA